MSLQFLQRLVVSMPARPHSAVTQEKEKDILKWLQLITLFSIWFKMSDN